MFGLWGLAFWLRSNSEPTPDHSVDRRERWPYLVIFIGVLLKAFGSAYYHLEPSNARLVWDRLPMAIAFMAVVAAMIAERIGVRAGVWLLPVLVLVGMSSVLQIEIGTDETLHKRRKKLMRIPESVLEHESHRSKQST